MCLSEGNYVSDFFMINSIIVVPLSLSWMLCMFVVTIPQQHMQSRTCSWENDLNRRLSRNIDLILEMIDVPCAWANWQLN